jgi:hypothetical protein
LSFRAKRGICFFPLCADSASSASAFYPDPVEALSLLCLFLVGARFIVPVFSLPLAGPSNPRFSFCGREMPWRAPLARASKAAPPSFAFSGIARDRSTTRTTRKHPKKTKAPTKGRGARFSIPKIPHPPKPSFPCALSINTNPGPRLATSETSSLSPRFRSMVTEERKYGH